MTLPTGTISMSQVNTELGIASTTTISLNQTNVRTLAGVPSGAISMQNLQGKSNTYDIEYLIIAGGAGGSYYAGGPGAGGYLTGSGFAVSPGTAYAVTIGSGGAGAPIYSSSKAANGSDSVFSTLTAVGGGAGGSTGSINGSSGGSGGGSATTSGYGGSATSGQGFAGRGGLNFGGGGGAGGTPAGEAGGVGAASSITGTSVYRGGGGPGGVLSYGGPTPGGTGGGGNSSWYYVYYYCCCTRYEVVYYPPSSGSANTGGGGGSSGANLFPGYPGGSGILVIRYPGAQRGTGGTVTSSGGYTIHTFTSSGTYTA